MRWQIETFFGWWKRHLKVDYFISRSRHGLMSQMLAGLIIYLLLTTYCHAEHNAPVSIRRVRQLRNQILNESRIEQIHSHDTHGESNQKNIYASP